MFGIAGDYRGMATRVATLIAGPPMQGSYRPPLRTDRYWALLPLALGIGEPLGILLDRLNSAAGVVVGALPVLLYFVAMMRLGWLYTPPSRRAIGPLFWTRRATAVPAIAFFSYAGALSLIYAVPGFR